MPLKYGKVKRYIGKINDVEAMKWIDNLYA